MKATIALELEFEIDFDAIPEERMTRHYPGCLAQIELCELEVIKSKNENIPLLSDIGGPELHNFLIETYSNEIEQACWEEVKESEAERAVCDAEYRRDSIMDR